MIKSLKQKIRGTRNKMIKLVKKYNAKCTLDDKMNTKIKNNKGQV